MDRKFNVTTSELIGAANFMEKSHGDITTIYTQVTNQVQRLQDVWGGDASQAFQGWYQEWKSGYDQMMDALQKFHQATTKSAQVYADTEGAVQNAFNLR
ncbi:WXG100 family type VII secretion target [Tumebacillus flagellatus]|uniref:ESAT-6-like protein n=1 Tax=Tumebacillus flagellatus TaxID=1157490 RepID=A0A074LNT9_9BACL|nr:WXG100 family type VII secretion target [Tumebacillus flagellatus]KEO82769.1 hypothetical protein EL26_13550 [Tumebacillus flagellatus]